MSSIKIVGNIEIVDDKGVTSKIPLLSSFTSVNDIMERQFSLTADTTAVIWDPMNWTGFQPNAFDYMIMMSDGDLDVELTTEASSAAYLQSFRLKANVPFILGADDAYGLSDTSSVYNDTLATINKIRVDEPNSTAVNLRLWLVD